jgi:hypothetical protein
MDLGVILAKGEELGNVYTNSHKWRITKKGIACLLGSRQKKRVLRQRRGMLAAGSPAWVLPHGRGISRRPDSLVYR